MTDHKPLLVSMTETAAMLCISRSKLYELISSTNFPPEPIRLGKKRLYSVAQLTSFVDSGCSPRWRPAHE